MKKDERSKNIIIVALCAALVFMSIGFATYTNALNINGTAEIQETRWDVHLNEPSTITPGGNAVVVTEPTLTADSLGLNYSVNLKNINDQVSFTVKVVNDGTLAAKCSDVLLTGADGVPYIDYTVTGLNAEDVLQPNEVKTVTVTVKFIAPADATQLPTTGNATLNLGAKFTFVQSD